MSQTSHLVALGRGGSLGTALVCFCWWAWFLLVWLLAGVCHCAGFSIWRLSFGLGLGFGLCSLTVACVGYAVLQFRIVFSLGFWAARLTEFGLAGSGSNAEASDNEAVKSLELWFGI